MTERTISSISSDHEKFLLSENLRFPAENLIFGKLKSKDLGKDFNLYSQPPLFQDAWVCQTLNFKRNGTFVDVGCGYPISTGNNTYAMEAQLGWRGISIDIEERLFGVWKKSDREDNGFYCGDAPTIDFSKLFEDHNMPKVIDYLSIDIDPPEDTLGALFKIPFNEYKFRCVTFETEVKWYAGNEKPSRIFLEGRGYTLAHAAVAKQDDFWTLNENL